MTLLCNLNYVQGGSQFLRSVSQMMFHIEAQWKVDRECREYRRFREIV